MQVYMTIPSRANFCMYAGLYDYSCSRWDRVIIYTNQLVIVFVDYTAEAVRWRMVESFALLLHRHRNHVKLHSVTCIVHALAQTIRLRWSGDGQ
jgi:hypothetical protein